MFKLLESWLAHQNARFDAGAKFEWRHPLPFLWNFRGPTVYKHQERLMKVEVHCQTQFYDGKEIHILDNAPLGTVEATLE